MHHMLSAIAKAGSRPLKAQRFVYQASPGPGDYTPRTPNEKTNKAKLVGSAAFRSNSDTGRTACYLREMGDPGQYDPYAHLSMGAQSARSFNRSAKAGTGTFGSRGQQTGAWGTGIGPGPIYSTRPNWIIDAKRGRLSAGFATKSQRNLY